MTTDRIAYLVLAHLTEPGNHELGALIRSTGPAAALDRVLHGHDLSPALTDAVTTRLAASGLSPTTAHRIAATMQHRADQLDARIVTPADEEWPATLDHLSTITDDTDPHHRNDGPPLCLWARGPRGVAETLTRSVSIVGARAMTGYGQFVASEFAHGLAERGWTIVSGGALGIDATAHRGALAAGGRTVAVLPCGIDEVYPVSNSALFERIPEEGLLLTEWPPGTRPHRARFLSRNRLIAASQGTVLVEAASRSGARSTLGYARLLQRSAMVVPGPITSAMSVGCHLELRRPGTVPVTQVQEIIDEVGGTGEPAPLPGRDAVQGRARPVAGPHPGAAQDAQGHLDGADGR
ncbi:DNA-processing protein DprA [Dactylosporangium sp. NPDC051485]|uniref:DNA-processing protein DprA n=1 Tax=Dactylosporangium sp. NPDC051485 TaxID=3154846 RepID=UPI00341C060F